MSSNFFAAWLFFFCRDYRRAIEQALDTLEMYPDCLHAHYVLGWSALAEGRTGDAVEVFEKSAALSRDAISIAYLSIAQARAGRVEPARSLLNELAARHPADDVPEFLFALIRAGLGELDAAVESLERCFSARDSRIFWFEVPPIGGPLLGYPKFEELMRRVHAAQK
jgi:tetratricopeptide (TPR) repeat protein